MTVDNLVIVAEAGASRNLAIPGQRLPLMGEWAELLRAELNRADPQLADLVGLQAGMSGPDFEESLGTFLAWQRVLPTAARYMPFGWEPGRQPHHDELRNWEYQAGFRAAKVIEAVHRTLFEQFNARRIDPESAAKAYSGLLSVIPINHLGGTTCFATTNYDPAIERALAILGRRPDVGASEGPHEEHFLDPTKLVDLATLGRTPVIHLHGKVGWYTLPDGSVRVESDGAPFNPGSGTPTVLMPDPDKNPLAEPSEPPWV